MLLCVMCRCVDRQVQTAIPWGLDLQETLLPAVLRDRNGYATHMIGQSVSQLVDQSISRSVNQSVSVIIFYVSTYVFTCLVCD